MISCKKSLTILQKTIYKLIKMWYNIYVSESWYSLKSKIKESELLMLVAETVNCKNGVLQMIRYDGYSQ